MLDKMRYWIARCEACALLFLAMLVLDVTSHAQSLNRESQFMTPFFAGPIATKGPRKTERANPVISDLLRSSSGPTILLVSDSGRASLMSGADQSGFGTVIPLPVEGYNLHLAEGSEETLWVGGYSKPVTSVFSTRFSYGYLAKVDRRGHLYWKREFGGQTERRIQGMVSLPSGGIAVSGRDSDRTWLAEISDDGGIIWERFIGLGKGSAVATADGLIILVAIEKSAAAPSYREDVAVWLFNQVGELLDRRVVREGINRNQTEYSEDIWIERGKNAIYVFSNWTSFAQPKPLEVARIDPRTGVIWRKELPATIINPDHGSAPYSCTAATTVLANGDALVACDTNGDEITLWRLSAESGALTESIVRLSAPPRNCEEIWSPTILLKARSEEAVWLFGSPQSSDEKPCGWIGEARTPQVK